MKTVKPRVIFNLLPKVAPKDRLVQIPMPHGPYGDEDGWGITLLEMFILIALGKHVGATQVLEFGTYRGGTTIALALNLPGVMVDTVDMQPIPPPEFEDFQNIDPLTADSLTLTTRHFSSQDLVWIDGGHEKNVFESDTRLAHALHPKVIVWHDCGNPAYPWIEEALEDSCFRVASTQLAVWPLSLLP